MRKTSSTWPSSNGGRPKIFWTIQSSVWAHWAKSWRFPWVPWEPRSNHSLIQGVERRRLREEARPTNLPQSSYERGPPDSLEYPTCHTTICVCSVEPKGKVCPATMENRHTSKYMAEDQTCRRSIPGRRWPCGGEGR